MSNAYDRVLVVGVSGPSSSGKSTLGRLLREILPHAFILHQDDYYKVSLSIIGSKKLNKS